MLLYHSTDDEGRAGIATDGFGRSNLRDSIGYSWFIDERNPMVPTGRRGWWVVVDVPDAVAALHREPEVEPGVPSDLYRLPWSVVNRYRPFTFQRWTPTEMRGLGT